MNDLKRFIPCGSQHQCSRRDALVCLAKIAGVGALAGACPLPLSAAENESPPQGTEHDEGQVVGTVRLTPEVRARIQRGLEYLTKPGLQKEDVGWGSKYRVGETALAVMALMLPGNVPGRGRYGPQMEAGIAYLIANARSQRGILGIPKFDRVMYEHALAVLALSEAWGQSKNRHVRNTLRRGVDVILRAQNEEGGWRYTPESKDADVSVTSMQLVALMAAKEAGIMVPQKTVDRATRYLIHCQVPDDGGFEYTWVKPPVKGASGVARSAAAVTALMLCGLRDHAATKRGVQYLRKRLREITSSEISSGGQRSYWHYYMMQAMYHAGEADFQFWYPKALSHLSTFQQKNGSWAGESGIGTVYSTSMAILVVGFPYRYLPIYQR